MIVKHTCSDIFSVPNKASGYRCIYYSELRVSLKLNYATVVYFILIYSYTLAETNMHANYFPAR